MLFYVFLTIFLALYFIIKAAFAKYKPKFGHFNVIIVLLGIVASFSIRLIVKYNYDISHDSDEPLMSDLRFGEEAFFDVILPLIIFPSGYNMRRKKFFRNIKTIFKFGIFGTLIGFTINSFLAYYAFLNGFL